MKVELDTIYLCDNGRAVCGEHLGAEAKYSGLDISGAPIEPVTPEMAKYALTVGFPICCEDCGKRSRLLHVA